MWSGAWSLTVDRSTAGLALSLGLAPMSTIVAAPIDGPHAIFGVVKGGLMQATASLRSYALQGIRLGHPLTPMVTYNTWFEYGTDIDEASMRAEMDNAAALGAELFVVDAGWYVGAGAEGTFDFDSGLGSWTPDPTRFPNGLKPLSDYAHSLGLKFGVWVEPERVNLSLVGSVGRVAPTSRGWRRRAAATTTITSRRSASASAAAQAMGARPRDGAPRQRAARLPEVGQQFLDQLRSSRPRPRRHRDGNFSHVNALYSLLAELRAKYPNLLIENVSGGGNRLDLGMAQYTDTAWMDDRTTPSVNVRHNAEGLSAVFPPAYLLSFLTDHDGEPLHDAADMPLYVRSRMAGALRLCFR